MLFWAYSMLTMFEMYGMRYVSALTLDLPVWFVCCPDFSKINLEYYLVSNVFHRLFMFEKKYGGALFNNNNNNNKEKRKK